MTAVAASPVSRDGGAVLALLPLVFARPHEALEGARGVLKADPTPHDASVAHHVIGMWQRDFGELAVAIDHLRRARALAARSGSADREADVLATLGVALTHAGRTREALAAFGRGTGLVGGIPLARVLFRRGYARWVLGHHREALDDLRRATPVFRQAGDVIWTARAFTLRATVHLALGAVVRAESDFREAERLWDTTGQEHDKADVVESLGLTAFRAGDIPRALRLLDDAARRYEALGTPMFMLTIRRCDVLMAAGLRREALQEADAAVESLDRIGGQRTRRAELLLAAARAASSIGDAPTAIARATAAVRLFASQRREWWEWHARLVLIESRLADGRLSGRLLRDAAAVATRLAELRSPSAVEASLLAGRIALALGLATDAERHLAAAARGRFRGPAYARAGAWAAHALRAEAAGSVRGVLGACRRGLDLLDEHRMTLGASELRASATTQGAELAALAQRTSLRSAGPRQLLVWSERWRATALTAPPVRPPADPELLRDVTAFRELTSRAESARSSGTPVPVLERELRRLEKEIRARTLHLRSEEGDEAESVTPSDGQQFSPLPGGTRFGPLRGSRSRGSPQEVGTSHARSAVGEGLGTEPPVTGTGGEGTNQPQAAGPPGDGPTPGDLRTGRGAKPTGGGRLDVRRLLDRLGDGRLIEIVAVDDTVHVLLCGRGRVRRFTAGRLTDAVAEVGHLRAGLRRLAHPGAGDRLAVLEAGGRRLEEILLGPAVRHLGPGPLVVVPPGRLHGVPWAVLPALRDRALSVSPSASGWLRAHETEPPPGNRLVLVRGPGLATGGAEVPRLAARYAQYGTKATVLEDGTASVPSVLDALDGARLAHVAAHGTFRADSPMFSALRMADGPLIVHDFERLRRSPYQLVLSSCDSGQLAPVGADELLGLSATLLPLGTASIVASCVPVNDEAAVPLMLALHEGIRAGLPLAEALRGARTALPHDPVHRVTGWAFSAIGAA